MCAQAHVHNMPKERRAEGGPGKDLPEEARPRAAGAWLAHGLVSSHKESHRPAALLSVFICLSSCLAPSSHVSVSQSSHSPGASSADKLSLPPPPEARHAHSRTQQKQLPGLTALYSLHFSSPRTCLIISLPVPKGAQSPGLRVSLTLTLRPKRAWAGLGQLRDPCPEGLCQGHRACLRMSVYVCVH